MAGEAFRYCIDTSSLVHAYQRSYPPDILPDLWEKRFDGLIDAGQLIAPFDVLEDLKQKHDDLHEWSKLRPDMFVEIDDYQDELAKIMHDFPRLVDTKKGKSGADPMVVALAMSRNPRLTVVTEEGFGSALSPKIPFVCAERDLRCINVLQLLRDQGWKFG